MLLTEVSVERAARTAWKLKIFLNDCFLNWENKSEYIILFTPPRSICVFFVHPVIEVPTSEADSNLNANKQRGKCYTWIKATAAILNTLYIQYLSVTRQSLWRACASILRQVSDSRVSGPSYQPTATCRVHHNLSPPIHTVTDLANLWSWQIHLRLCTPIGAVYATFIVKEINKCF